jgi:hypothetical protein
MLAGGVLEERYLQGCGGSQWWKPWDLIHKENPGQLDWARQREGSFPHQKPHVGRRSGNLLRDQGNDNLCGQQSSPEGHIGWSGGESLCGTVAVMLG